MSHFLRGGQVDGCTLAHALPTARGSKQGGCFCKLVKKPFIRRNLSF